MRVYVLIEGFSSNDRSVDFDILLVTTDLEKAKDMMNESYNKETESAGCIFIKDNTYINNYSAKITGVFKRGTEYCICTHYWKIYSSKVE